MAASPYNDDRVRGGRRRRRSRYDAVPRWLTVRRVVAATAALSLLLVGAWGARLVLSVANVFHTDPFTAVKVLVGGHGNSAVANDQRDLKRINIALYGYGGAGHDGAYLTDSIMVVSIQPMPQGPPRVAEISIPRDWYVPIDLGGGQSALSRINVAYESGQIGAPFRSSTFTGATAGGDLADATLERMLGIHIDYFVGLDFTAFKDAVDAVGGIDITVPHTFTDNNYPRGECPPDCAVESVHFDAGPQHMDGARALIFARSRESRDPQEGTNFARNKRQQLVLTAVKQRVLSIGGLKNLPDLLNALGDHVNTNIPIDSALSLYDIVKEVDTATVTHVSIDDTNFIHECPSCSSSIELPYDRTFVTVSHFVQNAFIAPDALAEAVPVTVVDASGTGTGASARWSTLLGDLGLQASDGGRGPATAATHVYDLSGGRGGKTAAWLAAYYGVTVEPASAAAGLATTLPAGGVALVLGSGEEHAFNNPARGLYG